MYIRFVSDQLNVRTGDRLGLFNTGILLEDEGRLSDEEAADLKSIRDWFKKNLEKPKSFSRSRKPRAEKVALSWFKASAHVHIRKMHEFKNVLENHGVGIEIIKTNRPGYIVYEDEFQIAAEPYADTKT